MLVINASYMPGGLSSPTRMNEMGLEQGNRLILMEKVQVKQNNFFEKNSGIGNRTRLEGKYGYQTGAKASLFLEIRASESP